MQIDAEPQDPATGRGANGVDVQQIVAGRGTERAGRLFLGMEARLEENDFLRVLRQRLADPAAGFGRRGVQNAAKTRRAAGHHEAAEAVVVGVVSDFLGAMKALLAEEPAVVGRRGAEWTRKVEGEELPSVSSRSSVEKSFIRRVLLTLRVRNSSRGR